ncbi:MAG TPA: GSCFA domain-containing protein [Xanthobacteraceae bacterium]|nr:GSCFA domain-containing protein [Xanthobacteraceae bacterium]
MTLRIPATEADHNFRKPIATWRVARDRLKRGRVFPQSPQTFSLNRSDTVLTMGSCFARNIEENLVKFGCRVPPLEFKIPQSEHKGERDNHVLSLFTPPAFRQTLEWMASIFVRDGKVNEADCEKLLFRLGNGKVVDLSLSGSLPVTYERFLERRRELYELYATAFRAECLLMTPGLVEAWYDLEQSYYTNSAPFYDGKLLDPVRYELRVLDHDECKADLLAAIDIVRKHNPKVKVLITVSPVPLRTTFTNQDVLVANTYSKSVLRAACQEIVSERPFVDYFPSFEAVMLSTSGVWERDHRHINDRLIGEIVKQVVAKYFGAASEETESDEETSRLSFSRRLRAWLKGSSGQIL